MSKRIIANSLATLLALLSAFGAMYASVKVMHMPETKLYWAVLLFSGAIVGLFVFFIIWGHFQEVPPTRSVTRSTKQDSNPTSSNSL